MNSVFLIGRLTKDPAVKFATDSRAITATFTLAIDRGKDKNGEDLGLDYPNIVCFNKTAELVGKYLGKGRLVSIQGRIKTGSYDKDGTKVYTTEVVADRIEFLDKPQETTYRHHSTEKQQLDSYFEPAVDWINGFDDGGDIPF